MSNPAVRTAITVAVNGEFREGKGAFPATGDSVGIPQLNE